MIKTKKLLNSYASEALDLAKVLYPINRSITGKGTHQSLKILKSELNELKIKSFKSGSRVFDWKIPERWNIETAKISRLNGEKVIDFSDNNLHVVSYSESVKKQMNFKELEKRIFTIPKMPNAIPYVTSYYNRSWGFCMSENTKKDMTDDEYLVEIKSTFDNGPMYYGEYYLPGEKKDKEILFSTYVCHPSMANNELSGPVVSIALAKYLSKIERKYSYRFLFLPETIGSIAYISKNLETMKKTIFAGLVLTCIGDERCFSIVSAKNRNPLEEILSNVITKKAKEYDSKVKLYSFLERGSDERQYSSPNVDLPISMFCRSKFGTFKEYHTSLDNFDLVTHKGIMGSIDALITAINLIEEKDYPKAVFPCEPNLGKRGLYPLIGARKKSDYVRNIKNILAYSDGYRDLEELSDILNIKKGETDEIVLTLTENGLLK